MRLPISQLEPGENILRFTSAKDLWVKELTKALEKRGYRVVGELKLDLSLTKLEPDYYLRGKMQFGVDQPCARCAENFTLPVDHTFGIALAHVSASKIRSPEISEESDELDVNFFEGNEIDLAPLIEEQFFLSIPYQSVCQKECKGICPNCGANLNLLEASADGHCACKGNIQPSPFSILERVKIE